MFRSRPSQAAPHGRAGGVLDAFKSTSASELFWNALTFDRLLTGPVIHLIYWAGLALIVLVGFSITGTAVGLAMREPGAMAWLLAIPTVVIGFLVLAIVALVWRSFCEFYVAIFRISDDLRIMRRLIESDHEADTARRPQPGPQPSPQPGVRAPRPGEDPDLLSKI